MQSLRLGYILIMHRSAPASLEMLLDRAEQICVRRGTRLTALRRQVLALVLQAPAPSGAYDLLEQLRAQRGRAEPPTVYRALEFLLAQGLIHRVERLAAFVGCVDEADHAHDAQFLICGQCKRVVEIEDVGVQTALANAAARAGFTLEHATIEAEGLCIDCNQGARAVSPPPAASGSSSAGH